MTPETPIPGPPSAEGPDANFIVVTPDRHYLILRRQSRLTFGDGILVDTRCPWNDPSHYEIPMRAEPEPKPPPGWFAEPFKTVTHKTFLWERGESEPKKNPYMMGYKSKATARVIRMLDSGDWKPIKVSDYWFQKAEPQIAPCRPPSEDAATQKTRDWVMSDEGRQAIEKVITESKQTQDQLQQARRIDPQSLNEPVGPCYPPNEGDKPTNSLLTALKGCVYMAQGREVVDWGHVRSMVQGYISPHAGGDKSLPEDFPTGWVPQNVHDHYMKQNELLNNGMVHLWDDIKALEEKLSTGDKSQAERVEAFWKDIKKVWHGHYNGTVVHIRDLEKIFNKHFGGSVGEDDK